jgi:hypothetical protein
MGFLAWIAKKIKFLFAGMAVIGPVLAIIAVWDAMHIRNVLANGTETLATIEGGKRRLSKRGSESFAINLTWTDAEGAQRRVDGVSISNDFARKVVAAPGVRVGNTFGIEQSPNWQLTRATVRIKYVASRPDSPVIPEDAAERLRLDDGQVPFWSVITMIGLAGLGLFYFVGRRRRAQAA